jgi:phosphoribosylglycinamide formyltransferase-1
MEAMPALVDPSDPGLAVQWPLPPQRPIHPADGQEPGAVSTDRRLRLGVMASGNGSNFEALVGACRRGELAAEVVLLAVNNPGCGAVARAERLGIPIQLHDHRQAASREGLDDALAASFRTVNADLVVMAGWMRIVTQRLIDAFPDRLVNIHPSLLPSFRGVDGVGQALAAGVTLTGCTAHLVRLEVDGGPILVQAAVPVVAGEDRAALARRIQAQEHRILPLAVQLAGERLGLP